MIVVKIAMIGLKKEGKRLVAYHEEVAVQQQKKGRERRSLLLLCFFQLFLADMIFSFKHCY